MGNFRFLASYREILPWGLAWIGDKASGLVALLSNCNLVWGRRLELAEEMLEGGEGVVGEHTWTGPAHHRLNAGFHVGSVAVYGAFAAGGLRCAVVAAV